MRTILSIGKRDAFYKNRAELLGQIMIVDETSIQTGEGGFIYCTGTIERPVGTLRDRNIVFYRVKLSKEKK